MPFQTTGRESGITKLCLRLQGAPTSIQPRFGQGLRAAVKAEVKRQCLRALAKPVLLRRAILRTRHLIRTPHSRSHSAEGSSGPPAELLHANLPNLPVCSGLGSPAYAAVRDFGGAAPRPMVGSGLVAGGLSTFVELAGPGGARGTSAQTETSPASRFAKSPRHRDLSEPRDRPGIVRVLRSYRTLALIVLVRRSPFPHGPHHRQDLPLRRQSRMRLVVGHLRWKNLLKRLSARVFIAPSNDFLETSLSTPTPLRLSAILPRGLSSLDR